MYHNMKIGKLGEELAQKYLLKENYKIIDKNFYCHQGELDIIAFSKNNELVFIEVKTRTSLKYGTPSCSLLKSKIRHIISCSKYYIFLNNFYKYNVRYDVIEVYISCFPPLINHIKNAFYENS